MSDGWHRIYGRADYNGWRLYILGTKAKMYVGSSFARCLWMVVAFRLQRLIGGWIELEPVGRVLEIRMVSPRQWPKESASRDQT
jgi:hypothetical protein